MSRIAGETNGDQGEQLEWNFVSEGHGEENDEVGSNYFLPSLINSAILLDTSS